MAALKDTEREWIVQRLACYETPADVAEAASSEFGKDVTRQQVEFYDPHRGRLPAEKWQELFQETRDEYLSNERRVAIANKLLRLRRLQNIVQSDDATRVEKMEALEQAAKESGDKYTNKQHLEHSGPDGGPIEAITADVDPDATDDPQQLITIYREAFTGNTE